jgi:4-oxalocrotonate tautomerase
MPHIQGYAIKDVITAEQKREVIEKLTDAMVSIEGENLRGVTWVPFTRSKAATGALAANT